jgi:hypothetical protein
MTEYRIVVSCPECGDARVSPNDVTVRGCLDDGAWSYRFTCPRCALPTLGMSTKLALRAAVDTGASFEVWTMPTRLDEHPGGPAFSSADVLEIQRLMRDTNWLEEVSRGDLDAER